MKKDILVDDLIQQYCKLHLSRQRQPRSLLCLIKNHFTPLRGRTLGSLTRLDILRWFQGIASPHQANTALGQLRTLYRKAAEWDLYDGDNKAVLIKKHTLPKRVRFVHQDEMTPLMRVLLQEPLNIQLYFLFELITGCRPGEARLVKWTDLKLWQKEGAWHGRWTKPDTKIRMPHVIPLPTALCERLLELPHISEWVFAGVEKHPRRKAPGPMSHSSVHKYWTRIRERAGLPDVRPHDLRRTCATWMDHFGVPISVISKNVLQHTNFKTTSIYVQTMPDAAEKHLNEHADRLLRGKS